MPGAEKNLFLWYKAFVLRFPEGHERDRGGKMTTCHVYLRLPSSSVMRVAIKQEEQEKSTYCFHHKYRTSFRQFV